MENNKNKSEIEVLTEVEGQRMLDSVQGIIPPIYSEDQAKEIFKNLQNSINEQKG